MREVGLGLNHVDADVGAGDRRVPSGQLGSEGELGVSGLYDRGPGGVQVKEKRGVRHIRGLQHFLPEGFQFLYGLLDLVEAGAL